MTGEQAKEKKTRAKRRVPGTDHPPRVAFPLRLEAKTAERLNAMLEVFNISRNEYIELLIESDLQHRERIELLNSSLVASHTAGKQPGKRSAAKAAADKDTTDNGDGKNLA